MDNNNIPLKKCTKCGVEYPATTEHWHKQKLGKYGLRAICKLCSKKYRQEHAEEISAYGYANRDKRREYHRQYNYTWHRQNRAHRSEKARAYYQADKERIQARNRVYNRSHPEVLRTAFYRNYTKKRSLPNTLTTKQWEMALSYFNGCCAVCGRQLKDLFKTHTAGLDHWIAITNPDCPGTVVTNIIPLCHGLGGCNNSKGNKPPFEWLVAIHGRRKANGILKRINAYFEWAKQQ